MPSNATVGQAKAAGPMLADLSVNELRSALGASNMPARGWGTASRKQLAEWAQQGIGRVGFGAVREHAERTAHLDYGERAIGSNTAAETAELRGMWPSVRRLDAASDGAYQLRRQLAADLLGVPESEVQYSARPAVAEVLAEDELEAAI